MTISGSLVAFHVNFTFSLNFTEPTFQLTEISSKLNNGEVKFDLQTETFSYNTLNIDIKPLNEYSMMLRKNVTKNSILLRFADTWFMGISNSLKNPMESKILLFRDLILQNKENILIKYICEYLKSNQQDILIPNDSITETLNGFQSISIKNIHKYDKCDGNSMFLKVKSYSNKKHFLQHNITFIIEYPPSTSFLTASSINSNEQGRRHKYYSYSTELYPSVVSVCTNIYLRTVQINIAFNSNIDEIAIYSVSNNVELFVETDYKEISSSLNICSQNDIIELKTYAISYISGKIKSFLETFLENKKSCS